MSFAEVMADDRRLVILRLLAESPGYSANEYLLASALPGFGHNVSHDRLRSDITWLAEQGLVSISSQADLQVAKLTARGDDVQAGLARCPGVKRPAPGE